MPQIKKPETQAAILDAALRLFRRHSYHGTTLAQIAGAAGMSSANLYVYFDSKLDILYAVYEPWMRARLTLLRENMKRIDAPSERLRLLLRTLWQEIPAEENGFVNNIVQALSTAGANEKYKPTLLNWMEEQIGAMVREALPSARRALVDEARLAHLMVMALDGYSIHSHINPRGGADDQTIDAMAQLLLGKPVSARRRKRAAHSRSGSAAARAAARPRAVKS